MQHNEKVEHGHFYHIYNHAVGGRYLFRKAENYHFFLGLYDKYIDTVAETYAWVLMPNHFHFLVKIKSKEEITAATVTPNRLNPNNQVTVTPDRVRNPVRGKKPKTGTPSQQFSKLFNSYAQAFNKYNETNGALFERPFKRKHIDNKAYLKKVILYIHNNPVHHGFCKHAMDYPWSSYLTCISVKPTKLHRETVVGWFDSEANFKTRHNDKINVDEINQWLGI